MEIHVTLQMICGEDGCGSQRGSSKTVDLDRPTLWIPRKVVSDKPSTYYCRAGEGRNQVVLEELPKNISGTRVRRLKYNSPIDDVKGASVFCLHPDRGVGIIRVAANTTQFVVSDQASPPG